MMTSNTHTYQLENNESYLLKPIHPCSPYSSWQDGGETSAVVSTDSGSSDANDTEIDGRFNNQVPEMSRLDAQIVLEAEDRNGMDVCYDSDVDSETDLDEETLQELELFFQTHHEFRESLEKDMELEIQKCSEDDQSPITAETDRETPLITPDL